MSYDEEEACYRVYYVDDKAEGGTGYTEVDARSEAEALNRAMLSDDKDFTHAEFFDEVLIDEL